MPSSDLATASTARPAGLIRVMTIIGCVLIIAQFHRTAGGLIATELSAAKALGSAELGVIMGAMFFASALVQIPTGLMFDRYGPRITVSSLLMIATAGTILFAFSTSFLGLFFGRALIGIGFAGTVSSILLLTMRWVSRDRFATVSASVIAIAGGLGGLIATAPLSLLFQAVGWTMTFVIVVIATVIVGFLMLIFVRDAPEGQAIAPGGGHETIGTALKGLWAMVHHRDLRRALIMATCAIAPFSCIGGLWAGPYLRDMYGFSQQSVSYVILGMVVALNIGTLGYGPLDRLFNTRKWVVLGGTGVMFAAFLGLTFLPGDGPWAAIVLLHLVALASPLYVTLVAHCQGFVDRRSAGRAITTMSLVGLTATFLAQWATGVIVAYFSAENGFSPDLAYRLVFAFMALMLVVAAAVYLPAPDIPPRDRPGAAPAP